MFFLLLFVFAFANQAYSLFNSIAMGYTSSSKKNLPFTRLK